MKYRKKPVVIEAVRYTGNNRQEMIAFLGSDHIIPLDGYADDPHCVGIIKTLEGRMNYKPGDWIIRGIKGEFYPCKADIFEATYDPAE